MTSMTIGQLAARTGLSVRTLRFYADAGVLPEATRSEAGYRLFAPDAVARARLVRTLRELGVGLDDVKRVLAAEASLAEVAARHAQALDAQIRTLRLQRAVLGAVARSTDPEELERMTELTTITADERRRIIDDYLDAVFGDADSAVVDKLRMGAPELPDDPTADQVAAWVELVELLRDPDYIAASRRMAERARAQGPSPTSRSSKSARRSASTPARPSARGVDPAQREALAVVERLEAMTPGAPRTARRSPTASRPSPTAASPATGRSSASSTAGRRLRARDGRARRTPGSGTPRHCARTPCRRRDSRGCDLTLRSTRAARARARTARSGRRGPRRTSRVVGRGGSGPSAGGRRVPARCRRRGPGDRATRAGSRRAARAPPGAARAAARGAPPPARPRAAGRRVGAAPRLARRRR